MDPSLSRWRGVLVVAGSVLVHLSLGTLYTFGNLSPYLTSYMRWYGTDPNLKYTECAWIFCVSAMGQGSSMFIGGMIEKRIGSRLTCLLGGWLMSLGVLLTYFAVKYSFAVTVITYGLMFGWGTGIAYAVPISCCVRWFPERKGLVSGLVVAGFGGGAFIFNQVQTAYINPNNLGTNQKVGPESYFTQPEVLDNVPSVFLLLAGCYAAMQLIGSLLLCHPPANTMEETEVDLDQDSGDHNRLLPDKRNNSSRSPITNAEDVNDWRPSQMLKSKYFYMLWFIFLLNGQGSGFISSLYKAYGQTFISDDSFLALVGSFAAVFNAGGRIWWGYLADKTSFRVAMLLVTALFTCLMLTLQATSLIGKSLFFIYVCLLFGAFSGSFSLLPTAIAKMYGRKHFSINYGLLFTSQVVTSPIGVLLNQYLMDYIGWNGLFFLVSSFAFTSMLITLFFNATDRFNKEI